ncbi:oligosaccharide flippase family protein [Rhizobium sp. BR 314]|uniref:oligosaccharide flippase family protein n=1 Tax=Rhizobium sp. BR 314 TaxID=3040013 RepID=UPI0039BF0C34
MPDSSIAPALKNAFVWNAINAIFSQVAGFVIFLVLAHMLNPTIFGAVALSAVVADFVAVDGRYAGMDAILQRGTFDKNSLNAAFLALSLIAAPIAIILLVAGPIVAELENVPLIGYYMPIFGILLLATPWLSVMDAIIMRDLGFKTFAKRNMLSTIIGGIAGIGVAFSPLAIWALPVQRVTSTLFVLIFEFLHTQWVPGLKADAEARRDLFRRLVPLWLIAAINLSMQRATVLVFGIRFDSATVGLFRAADRISESVQNPIISPLFALWFPLMSKVRGNGHAEAGVFTAIIRTSAFVALPAFAGMIVVADDVTNALLPQAYQGVAPILRAVSIASLMIPVSWFNPIAMNALGMNKRSLQYSAVAAATCIGALVAIPTNSPQLAVLIMAAPALFYGLYGNLVLLRRLRITPLAHYLGLLPAALAAAAMAVGIGYVRSAFLGEFGALGRLAILVALGIVIYFGLLASFCRQWMVERVHLLMGRRA